MHIKFSAIPVRGAPPSYAYAALYQDIVVGKLLTLRPFFSPDGHKIEVIDKHETACGERRLTYVRLPRTNTENEVTYSVPHGILGNHIYISKPSAEQIAANAEEKNQTEVLDCWPKYI